MKLLLEMECACMLYQIIQGIMALGSGPTLTTDLVMKENEIMLFVNIITRCQYVLEFVKVPCTCEFWRL